MKKIIIANWKMQGSSQHCHEYVRALRPYLNADVELVICPPFPYLAMLHESCEDNAWALGGQNCHAVLQGAFTGEVSAAMLHDIGCLYVLVGHSERRQYGGETDTMVAQKCMTAHEAGLIPIVCVGETREEKKEDRTQAVITQQLLALSLPAYARFLVAYEPVWAIGTGIVATREDITAAFDVIKKIVPTRPLLYGGSVKPDNAAEILSLPNVDGVLVGGASLDVQQLGKIIQAGEQAALGTKGIS